MNKKPIKLTEQDLHFLVENTVQAYLTENGIAQLVGGKYNDNKFGRMSGMIANRKSQISRRGGQYS